MLITKTIKIKILILDPLNKLQIRTNTTFTFVGKDEHKGAQMEFATLVDDNSQDCTMALLVLDQKLGSKDPRLKEIFETILSNSLKLDSVTELLALNGFEDPINPDPVLTPGRVSIGVFCLVSFYDTKMKTVTDISHETLGTERFEIPACFATDYYDQPTYEEAKYHFLQYVSTQYINEFMHTNKEVNLIVISFKTK